MRYDVIVIGLGAMGSASLYQLSKRGATVLGIDRYHPPHHFGSSYGETRITRLATGEGAIYVPLVRRSHEIWRELEAVSGHTLLTLSGGVIVCPKQGGAQFHGQADFVTQTAVLAQQFGIDHAVWEATSVQEQWPILQIQPHEHAYYEPTGGILHVEQCIETQLQLAQQAANTTVHFDERVLDYHYYAQGVTVTTDKGRYEADKIILAAGPWVAELVPEAVAKPFAVYRQVIYWFDVADTAVFLSDHFPFVLWIGESLADFFCIFPYDKGQTAGAKVLTETYVKTVHPDRVMRTVQPYEIEKMYRHFVAPRVHGVSSTCLKTGVCLYTVTPDEDFVIDFHPDSDRVIVASPCSGHGFKHSAAIGEVLAQLSLEGETDFDLAPFGFERF